MSTAQVSNVALMGSAARLAQARAAASSRQLVDNIEGSNAPPPRDEAPRYEDIYNPDPVSRRRRGAFQDHVASFGGVLVSQEVGDTLMQAQALNGTRPLPPAEAEKQVANYEFVQSLAGPAQIMITPLPFR